MPFRSYHSAPVAELGQVGVINRKRALLILSVPALSLLLPGLAVEVADAGGSGELTRIAAAVAKFLLFYSGVFALIGLSAAVAAGLLATDRIVMTPEARILSQAAHRTMSLIGISALANHIMLEIMASRAGIADSVIPFVAVRSTFFMGLGTLSSDLFVLIILTGVLRRRFTQGSRPQLWRWLHLTAYVAWPMGILHGLLAGRSAKPYVDWSYGACLAFAALALIARYVLVHRGRNAAAGGRSGPGTAPSASAAAIAALPPPQYRPAAPPQIAPRPRPAAVAPQRRSLRALPSPEDAWSRPGPRPPRWTGAPWTAADAGEPPEAGYYGYDGEPGGYDGYDYDGGPAGYDGYEGEPGGYDGQADAWTGSPDAWTGRPDGWNR